MTKTFQPVVDGQSPLWVRDTSFELGRPHGWRSTSNGFALIGCEPAPAGDAGAHPLDWSDRHADIASSKLRRGTVFDLTYMLDQCRRYRATNYDQVYAASTSGEEIAVEFEHIAGPFEVDCWTRHVPKTPPRYRVRCACGEHSKWYLQQSRRYLLSFQSKHRCAK